MQLLRSVVTAFLLKFCIHHPLRAFPQNWFKYFWEILINLVIFDVNSDKYTSIDLTPYSQFYHYWGFELSPIRTARVLFYRVRDLGQQQE